jgi:hypothetical protein
MTETTILAAADADLARIEKREAELRAEMDSLASERNVILAFKARALRYMQGVLPGIPAHPDITLDKIVALTLAEKKIPRDGSKAARLAESAIEMIGLFGPQPIAELLDHAKAGGIEINSKNPNGYLAGILSRDPRLEFMKGIGWRLVEPRQTNEAVGTICETPPTASSSNSAVSAEGLTPAPVPSVEPDGGGGT